MKVIQVIFTYKIMSFIKTQTNEKATGLLKHMVLRLLSIHGKNVKLGANDTFK